VAAVGLVILKPGHARPKTKLHSAAGNVSQLFATGSVAMLLELGPGSTWLVAIHEGAVVARTDTLYRSSAEARSVLDELKQAYPQLVVLGSRDAPASPTLAMIEAASASQTQLAPLRRWRSILPAPVQWFALILLLALLGPAFWQAGVRAYRAKAPPDVIVPAVAWSRAQELALRDQVVHGVEGTRMLLQAFHGLPVRLAGWALIEAGCTARRQSWRCQARYDRRDQQATNDQLLANAPQGWSVGFVSMDQAQPVWDVMAGATPLVNHQPKGSEYTERTLLSFLQAIKPAFAQIQLGQPKALKVVAPRDRQGNEVARPDGLPRYFVRSVKIKGPLRSSVLLLPHTRSIGWQKIMFQLRDTEQPGLRNSRITVSFQGELYEMETTPVLAGLL
jgi:hypothetical protein